MKAKGSLGIHVVSQEPSLLTHTKYNSLLDSNPTWASTLGKPVFGGLPTTNAQTSLRIRAVRSVPLLFIYWKVSYLDLLRAKFQFSD